MPVIVHTSKSQVAALWGRSFIRDANGKFRLLALGDVVQRGDVILTEQNAIVKLTEAGPAAEDCAVGTPRAKGADTTDMDRVIAGIECGDESVATAAGSSASSADGGLLQGERVERVKEDVSPATMLTTGLQPVAAGIAALSAVPVAFALGSPTAARLSSVQAIGSSTETEDKALVFPVELDGAGTVAVTLPFELQLDSASAADIQTPIFSNGVVLNDNGTITIPPGITSFDVTVPLVDDSAVEATEQLTVRIGSQTASGTLRDNDIPSVVGVEAGEPGAAGDAVVEGDVLVYTVTLSEPTASPALYPFALGGGSAEGSDHEAPRFSQGVVLNADGTISVPQGVSSFTVTVPTVDDLALETQETVPLSVGGVTSIGLIDDNDGVTRPTLTVSIADSGLAGDGVAEGQDLVFNVQLSTETTVATVYPFEVGLGSAGPADVGSPLLSDGVVINPDGASITVPPGVSTFSVTIPSLQDSIVEADETLPLIIDTSTATGTIIDDDKPVIEKIEPAPPTGPGAAPGSVPEGDDLVYTVTLSQPPAAAVTYPFSLGGGTASGDDIGQPSFSNGVLLNSDGTITVPAGVASFTVTVPTLQDSSAEANESVPLTIDTVTVTGTIIDDDKPVIEKIEPAPPTTPGASPGSVPEGDDLVYTVTLSQPPAASVTYPFSLGGGTASGDDIGQPSFSNGVLLNSDGTITVPAGVASFTVTVPTLQDSSAEANESVPLTIDAVTVTGTIVDDDKPVIEKIEPAPPTTPGAAPGSVPEGDDLVYTVTLSQPPAAAVTYPFSLGGGTASGDDIGQPSFSDGVLLNSDGTITVPAGVASFTVTVPTLQDSSAEANESVPLTIDTVTVTGTIIDDDKPVIEKIEPAPPTTPGAAPGSVPEGDDIVYTVTLSQPPAAAVTYPFSLGGGTASGDDIGQPSFSNGVLLNSDGTITVPAGVTSFTVTVPTIQDTRVETTESVPLTIDGVAVTGTIVDDDKAAVVFIEVVPPSAPVPGLGAGEVVEGQTLTYRVQLNQATATETVYPFELGGGSAAADDFGRPVFSDGVVLNADGTITVPAGVSSFEVQVPTTQDTAAEPMESLPLTIDKVSATGLIVDDDRPTVVQVSVLSVITPTAGVTAAGTVEGGDLVYSVKLSQPTAAPTTYPFSQGSGSAGEDDVGAPVFSNGVVLNADGTITVPPGIDSFTVRMSTVQDAAVESTETAPIVVDSVVAIADIVDDDKPLVVKVESVAPSDPGPDIQAGSVVEGGTLHYTVQLDQATVKATTYAFGMGGGSAGAADVTQPTFSHGVILNSDGTITVPAGVSSFSVLLPTVQDDEVERSESVPLNVDRVEATGYILDDDKPSITCIEPGVPGAADDTVPEGGTIVFAVTLSGPPSSAVTYPFSLGGGSAEANDFGAPSFTDGVVLHANGTITVPAGVSAFTVRVPTAQDSMIEPQESLPLTIGNVSATAVIVDDDVNRAPAVESVSASVSEEGLIGGIRDTQGNPIDQGDNTTASGRINITDPDGDAVSGVVLTAPATSLSSGGQPIIWQGSGTQSLTAVAGGETVATVTVNDEGQYSFTLCKPIDHPTANGENVLALDFGVQATDQGPGAAATGAGVLTINIEDDKPVANAITDVVVVPEAVATNVMLVLDVSGSMGQASGMAGLTRLQAAVQSIETLLDRYDAQGDVAVRLVTFGEQGKVMGSCWTSVTEAKATLACLKAYGGTNYDDALGDAIKAFEAPGKLPGGSNVSYFLSDGVPTHGSGSSGSLSGSTNKLSGDIGIQAGEADQWHQFLDHNGIDSHAFAMGTGISNASALAPIAHDGRSGSANTPLMVDSFADLPSALLSTTVVPVTGQLVQAGGADGAHLHSFTVDDVIYTYTPGEGGAPGNVVASATGAAFAFDPATQLLTLSTAAGGSFAVDFAGGSYSYQGPAQTGGVCAERFCFAVMDGDGDVAQASGHLQLVGSAESPAASVTAVSAPAAVAEGSHLEFEVAMTASNRVSTLELNLGGSGATLGVDTAPGLQVQVGGKWVSLSDSFVEVPAQTTSLRVRVATVDDRIVESTESVVLTVKSSDGSSASASGSILDNDRSYCQVETGSREGSTVHSGWGGLPEMDLHAAKSSAWGVGEVFSWQLAPAEGTQGPLAASLPATSHEGLDLRDLLGGASLGGAVDPLQAFLGGGSGSTTWTGSAPGTGQSGQTSGTGCVDQPAPLQLAEHQVCDDNPLKDLFNRDRLDNGC